MSPEIMLIISFITKILGSVGPGFGGMQYTCICNPSLSGFDGSQLTIQLCLNSWSHG
jgi:hypothetical protein